MNHLTKITVNKEDVVVWQENWYKWIEVVMPTGAIVIETSSSVHDEFSYIDTYEISK